MSSNQKKSTLPSEGRGQPRIQARVPIRVAAPGGAGSRSAVLVNLSWGGALFQCSGSPGAVGDALEVELPYHVRESIRIDSEILRVMPEPDGQYSVAVRFSSISPGAESHLEKILAMLMSGPGGGRREHPRLAQRLDIYFDDPTDIRATLEDISRGGLAVMVPYSFQPGQSVQLTVFGGAGIGELRLRARVMNQTAVEDGKLQLYRIGLKFEHPSGDLQEIVNRLLDRLTSKQALAARQWKNQ